MTFSFLDLVLFAGVVQGIFLVFSLQFISRKNRKANKLLTIIIGLATFIFAGKMAAFQINALWVWRFSLLSDCTIYLFGPLLYAYFRTLVYKDNPKDVLSFKHFIPSLLLFLFFCWTLTLTWDTYAKMSYTFGMMIVYFTMELVGVISLIFYSFISYKIVRHLKNSTPTEAHAKILARYIQFILIGISMIIIFWIAGIFRTYILHSYSSYIIYRLVWISIATFLFIIGYFSFTQPEIIRLPFEKKSTSKDRLTPDEIKTITQRLQLLIDEEQIFIRQDVSLKMLAKRLNTTANNLSWLLNSVYRKTFYEYINEHRIKAFLTKIEEGEHKKQTLFSLAMEVGFNSKSTFNKSFKMMMHETPSKYIEKVYP